jgi:GTP:adenosylcobinamide-phosphate guanylyltransferase
MQDVVIFAFGRIQSQRCPNKMLRPFGDTTLTDILLDKLAPFKERAFFAGYEDVFREKCEAKGVPFVQRNLNSVMIDGPIVDILHFLKDIDAKYFLEISGCLPLLSTQQIQSFLDECLSGGCKPAMSAKLHRNFFLTEEKKGMNFDITRKTLNTKLVEPVWELVNALYFFEKDYFFEHGTYWPWDEMRLLEIGNEHLLVDVDTEDDFVKAEHLWTALNGRGKA